MRVIVSMPSELVLLRLQMSMYRSPMCENVYVLDNTVHQNSINEILSVSSIPSLAVPSPVAHDSLPIATSQSLVQAALVSSGVHIVQRPFLPCPPRTL